MIQRFVIAHCSMCSRCQWRTVTERWWRDEDVSNRSRSSRNVSLQSFTALREKKTADIFPLCEFTDSKAWRWAADLQPWLYRWLFGGFLFRMTLFVEAVGGEKCPQLSVRDEGLRNYSLTGGNRVGEINRRPWQQVFIQPLPCRAPANMWSVRSLRVDGQLGLPVVSLRCFFFSKRFFEAVLLLNSQSREDRLVGEQNNSAAFKFKKQEICFCWPCLSIEQEGFLSENALPGCSPFSAWQAAVGQPPLMDMKWNMCQSVTVVHIREQAFCQCSDPAGPQTTEMMMIMAMTV